MTTDRCCNEVSGFHGHDGQLYFNGQPYYYRCTFEWRWPPKLLLYRAGIRRWSTGFNRYPGVVIGAYVQVGWRVLSFVWGRPGRAIELDGP